MQKFAKKTISILMVACMLLSVLTGIVPLHTHVHAAGSFASVGGWLESIYAEISGISDADVTAVSYSGTKSGSLTGQDLEYLVRTENGKVRIDIPGVPEGTYTLTVTAGGTTYTQSGIKVQAHDRSGYAHFNRSEGVGAYNNDGSLKANAIVLYVTNSNKNTVTVTSKDGTTVTGIGNILGSTGMDVGTGATSKGGKPNTNQDILRKLAADGTPLVIRIIGNVKGASSTSMSSAKSEIDGLTAFDSIDYGGSVGDNGFMARTSGGKDITIEGIGTGATIDGWGLHFICQTDDYAKGYGQSYEVRNLTFKNVPEDCIGFEGQQDGSTLTAPVERCWVHNCSFIAPSISGPAESDKDGGDGACDFKRGNYMTMDYCYYDGYHKTNLVGSSDSSLQYHITWHHNYWKNCDSRGPLGRQANMHIYNCIFEGQTSYAMNPRANCYIFSEYNSFINCKNPVTVDSGAVKSYKDTFTSCTGDNNATVVTDKSKTVSTSNKYANFDTNSSVSYIPSSNYELDEDYDTMLRNIKAYAGAMPATVVAPEDVNTSTIPSNRMPTAAVALPYSQSLNNSYISSNGTKDNIVFNVSKFNSDSLTVGGNANGYDIVFYVDRTVNISMTAVSGTYSPVLCAASGKAVITGNGSAENVPAGYYYICSGGWDPGSSKYKEAKVASLKIEAVVVHGDNDHVWTNSKVVAPTCTEAGYTLQKCSCGAERQTNATAATGHKAGAAATCLTAQTCTACGTQLAAALGHSYSGGKCSRCGAIDPSSCAHSDTTTKNAKEATCSAEGYTGDTFCNTCQTTVKTGSTIAKLAHTGGAAATCTTAQTCTVCGATITAALGHNYVGGKCTRCGAEDLAAAGYLHIFEVNQKTSEFYTIAGDNLNTGKGSITLGGVTYKTCLKMNSNGNVKFTAPADGTFTLYFNNSSGKKISVAGTEFTLDAEGIVTVNVTANQAVEIKRTDGESFLFAMEYAPAGSSCAHANTTTTTEDATCNTAGSTTVTCSDCGVVVSTTSIPATNKHTAGAAANCVTAQTCTVCGTVLAEATGKHTYENGKCSVCGAADASSCAHSNTSLVNAKAATCTAQGYTGDTYCNTCKTTIATGSVIAKKSHTPGAAADCTNAQICTVCQTVITAALGHNYSGGKCTRCGAEETTLTVGGWFESAWAEWAPVDGASGYNVYYKAESGSWTQIDTELIRSYGNYWRADVVGLKAGKYQLCVAPVIGGKTGTHMHSDVVTVIAHNRDGYAHTNGSVGAYNNDGTLKSGAIVVYVTADNINSVTANIGGTTYTGLDDIVYTGGKKSSVPICVRIIGEIKGRSTQVEIKENVVGITVEGIGEDATCNGWGVYLSRANNVEVRNLAFMNNATSEGDSVTLANCTYCWVHNCEFFYGTDRGGDKDKGDGALDTKTSKNITHSYNHFWDCGKCNLQGSGTSDTSDNITYHHNWYDHSDSRHPRVRVATVHVYNNFYDGVAKYGIGNAYKAEVISEGNYFLNTNKPMLTSTQGSDKAEPSMSSETPGTLTSYKDYVVGATSWIPNVDGIQGATSWSSSDYDCVIVDTRFSGYSYTLQTAEEARTNVTTYAGRVDGGDFEFTFTEADAADYARNAKLDAALSSYATSMKSIGGKSVTEEHVNCTHSSTTTVTNEATCTAAGSIVVKCTECGAVVSSTTIPAKEHNYTATVTKQPTCAVDGVRTYTCSNCNDTYTEVIAATGNHNYVDGKCTGCGLVDPNACAHTNTTTATVDPTCTVAGSETVTCDACGKTISTKTIDAKGHTEVTVSGTAATCTAAGLTEGKKCSVCGVTTVAQQTIAALGHNYSGGKCTRCGAEETALSVGGWFEAAWAEWESVAGASGYNVYYKAESGNWTQIDAELIRSYGDYWRADVVGLKAGKYQLCVAPVIGGSTGTHMHSDLVTVMAHDRSGYGFVNGTSSGAYNDDGTLKSNALVIYVTDSNKNSVSATVGGTSCTGIAAILGEVDKATTPICIRLIGNITDPSGSGGFDKGDLLIDNNGNTNGLTIEGIGEDATCNGFGIRLKNSSNVEIRNLAVMNCDSSEGDNIGLQQANDHIWVHNCDLFYGHAGSDADQVKGDGALDTKKSHYVTHSYNHFWDCGKCNLQGGSTSDTSDNITYHHNWYDHSDSRHPRVRVATVHVYNNYYDGVSKYGIGNAYNAEVISECNYFRNTKNPMLTSTQGSDQGVNTMSGENPGTLTSYNDYVVGATSWIPNVSGIQGATSWSADNWDCVIVNTTYTAYSYNLQTAEEAKTQVENYAGRIGGGDFTWDFNDAVEDTNYEVIPELKAALGAYDDSIASIGGKSVAEEHVNCAHPSTTTVTTEATCTVAGSTVEKCTECGTVVSTTTIPALGHKYVNGTCSRCGLIDASTCAHSNETSVVTAPTCTEAGYTTYTCTACGTTRTANQVAATGHTAGAAATCTEAQTCTVCGETITAALGHNYVDGVCTRCGAEDLAASGYVHNFTTQDKTSTFYTITGNLSTKYGTVNYNGLSLTQGLKIESSTNISFNAPKDGTLTLVFVEASPNIKVDGTKVTGSNGIITVDVAAGSHTLTKADTMNLFYMVYEPASSGGDVHTHNYVGEVTTAATCTTAGVKTFTCSCGVGTYTETIPALGHTPGAAATCTEAQTCTVCKATITAALGHSYTSTVTAPTCTEQGYTTHVCARGDHSYVDTYVAATGHTEVVDAAVAATCTTAGKTEGKHCNTCGEVLTAQTVVEALGHAYKDGICTRCGAADPEYVSTFTVSGSFVSHGKTADAVAIQFFIEGQTEAAYSFVSDGAGNSGDWSIAGVVSGTYTVKVSKANHVSREYELTVGEENVTDMNVEIWLQGDTDGDGLVNVLDYGNVLRQVKYPEQPILTDYNRQCADANGDGEITFWDYLLILWHMKGSKLLW